MQLITEDSGEPLAEVRVDPKRLGLGKRLLVVEDSRCIQMRLISFVRSMGFDVDTAADGEAACKMAIQSQASERPYNVILMDVQMPKMDGKRAMKWLREKGWQGPVIAVSMHSSEKDRTALMAAGFDSLLPKPFSEATLRDTLAAFLGCD